MQILGELSHWNNENKNKKYGYFNLDFNLAADFELMLRFFNTKPHSFFNSSLNFIFSELVML
jgi:hypothetical protein